MVAHQAPPPMGFFSGKNTGMGCHFPSPVYLPYPGIEPMCPALKADSLPAEPSGKPLYKTHTHTHTTTVCVLRVSTWVFLSVYEIPLRAQRMLHLWLWLNFVNERKMLSVLAHFIGWKHRGLQGKCKGILHMKKKSSCISQSSFN